MGKWSEHLCSQFHVVLPEDTARWYDEEGREKGSELFIGRENSSDPFLSRDFFRRSLYVKALGEIGLAEAIPALRETAHSPGLDKRWSESLRRDVAQAIARIEALSASNPTE